MFLSIDPTQAMVCHFLGVALHEVFPGAELGDAEVSDPFFSYSIEKAFPEEMLPLVEEKLREVCKRGVAVELLEMVPVSARELFLHLGQKKKAARVEEWEGLVPVVKIGEYYDVSFDPRIEGQAASFQLLGVEGNRVLGVAGRDKKEVKERVKRWRRSPTVVENEVWTGEWVTALDEVEKRRREIVFAEGITRFVTSGEEREAALSLGVGSYAGRKNLFTICSEEKVENALTYCLQLIEKTFKLLEISTRWILVHSQVGYNQSPKKVSKWLNRVFGEYSVEAFVNERLESPFVSLFFQDAMGKWIQGPEVKVVMNREILIEWSLFGSDENFVRVTRSWKTT
ncbi:MAG: hypothetical protein KDK65_06435 [Chlamydiia bacterium]|nr:hypothetical protein [Chlamydiia bacterium]